MPGDLPSGRRVAPSILSADYSRLGAQVREVMDAGARVIHVDVMDGQFVPRITIGPLIVDSIRDQVHDAGGWLDVHLMIERPGAQFEEFVKAGADSITFHFEATPHSHYAIKMLHEFGCKAGIAINPGTPAEFLTELVDDADIVLCMTVNPGWGAQQFIPTSTAKVGRLRGLAPDGAAIEVDGGIDVDTAPECAEAGAGLFVAGSAVLAQPDPGEAYRQLAESIGAT